MMDNGKKVISMWSGPRNISTALMYAFRQHSQLKVIDEPFYAAYLTQTAVVHPGQEAVLESQPQDYRDVLSEIDRSTANLFLKNMAHHLTVIDDWSFLRNWNHVLLLREPAAVVASLSKQLPHPVMRDTGFEMLVEVFHYLKEQGRTPVIIETHQLLTNPQAILTQVCDAVGLDFEETMLHWPVGPKPEDGIWAPHWYANVHKSTGFNPPEAKHIDVREDLLPLIEACEKHYETLKPYILTA